MRIRHIFFSSNYAVSAYFQGVCNMPAPSKFREIEAVRGKPMPDILAELFDQFGTQIAVARELGVGQGTLNTWLLKLGLEQKTVLVPAGGSRRAGADRQPEGAIPLPGFESEVSGG
jgi:hypothetical protein